MELADLVIPLGEFLPDQNIIGGGLSVAQNVLPIVGGYGPLKSFYSISDALANTFAGGGSFVASDGNSYLLVGTDDGLEKYSGGTWTNLVTGMTVTGHWRFTQFGDYVVGVNGSVTKVTALAGGSGTTTTLASAPAGVCVATVGDYVVIGQDAGDLTCIYTSGTNDHTDWDIVSGTATYQPMLEGGEVMGLAGGEYGVILQRQRLVRMSVTGDATAPFTYDPITDNVGCASKGSVCQAGRTVYFLSDRGFMALDDGQALRPIGSERVDRTFQNRILATDYERIFSAVDPQRKLVYWMVPGAPSYVLIYNFALDKWSEAEFTADGLFPGFTSSTGLDTLAATYTNIDTMTISLDDPRWRGGAPAMYLVQSGELGTFDGDNLAATMEGSFSEYVPGRVTRFRAIRPISDSTSLGISLDCRARVSDSANVKVASDLRASGIMPIRASGRFIKFKWTDSGSWSFAQGFIPEVEAGGER